MSDRFVCRVCVFIALLAIGLPFGGAAHPRPKADLEGGVCGPVSTTRVQLSLNLDAYVVAGAGPFDPADPNNTSDFRTTVTVFSAEGAATPMTIFFDKDPAANLWNWTAAFDPSDTTVPAAAPTDPFVQVGRGRLTFDSDGVLRGVTGSPLRLDLAGAAPGQLVDVDFGPIAGVGRGEPTSQFAAESRVHSISQDGLGLDACRFAAFLRVAVQPQDPLVQLRPGGVAWVVVHGSEQIPVRALAKRSLRFGPARVRPLGVERRDFWRRHVRDLDGDDRPDLLLRFPANRSGLAEPRDTACLDGRVAGRIFQVCRPVAVCGAWCQREVHPREVCGPRPTTRVEIPVRRGGGDAISGPFDPGDPFGTSSHRAPFTVFDSLGAAHPVSLFVSRSPGPVWEWTIALDPSDTVLPPAVPTDPFVVIATGDLATGTTPRVIFDFAGGAALGQAVDLEFDVGVGALTRIPVPWPGQSYALGATGDGQPPGRCRIELVEPERRRRILPDGRRPEGPGWLGWRELRRR